MANQKNKQIVALKTHNEMVEEWLKDPVFKSEYNALEQEYALLREMLQARKRAGLTQAEVAESMGTKASAVARLEAASAHQRHSPSLSTLRKYAQAVNCALEIHLKPISKVE